MVLYLEYTRSGPLHFTIIADMFIPLIYGLALVNENSLPSFDCEMVTKYSVMLSVHFGEYIAEFMQ